MRSTRLKATEVAEVGRAVRPDLPRREASREKLTVGPKGLAEVRQRAAG
jgi:hypothetical protein